MNAEVEVVVPDEAAEQAAYDAARGITQETEEVVEQQIEETVATETPQAEPEVAKDELTELRSQVEKMGDVFKRLDDVNGRYGRLSQRVEEMQQKIVASPNTAAGVADAKELMKEMQDYFPELAAPLEKVIARVMASKGGLDQEALTKAVAEMRAAEAKAETVTLETQLDELHPGWDKITGSQAKGIPASEKFAEWFETLSKRDASRLSVSRDPFYVAEMIEKHNEWLAKEKPKPEETQQTKPENQANKKRLADAVMPKGSNAPLSATQISEQEAYDKARAEARRIKK